MSIKAINKSKPEDIAVPKVIKKKKMVYWKGHLNLLRILQDAKIDSSIK